MQKIKNYVIIDGSKVYDDDCYHYEFWDEMNKKGMEKKMIFKKVKDNVFNWDRIELLEQRVSRIKTVRDFQLFEYEWVAICDDNFEVIDEVEFMEEVYKGNYELTTKQ